MVGGMQAGSRTGPHANFDTARKPWVSASKWTITIGLSVALSESFVKQYNDYAEEIDLSKVPQIAGKNY